AAGPISRILSAAPSPRSVSPALPPKEGGRTGHPAGFLRSKTRSGRTIIPLGRTLLHGSSDLPGSCDAPSRHVGPDGPSSPIWSCSVWGFPCHRHYWQRGALLPHHFTLTPIARGGIFSVALSVNGP